MISTQKQKLTYKESEARIDYNILPDLTGGKKL